MQAPDKSVDRDPRWAAVLSRDRRNQGFVYAVTTTGIYCRPSCPSRRPQPNNVMFFNRTIDAEQAGFRACLRCHPVGDETQKKTGRLITQACRQLQSDRDEPSLHDLAADAGMSQSQFHRAFKSATGTTPKTFARAYRMKRMRDYLADPDQTITSALYESGFTTSSRFYETATRALGMTPICYRKGGKGQTIIYGVSEAELGFVLVACTRKGVSAILLGDTLDQVLAVLRSRFYNADLVVGDQNFIAIIRHLIGSCETPSDDFGLPRVIRETAFKERIWKALRQAHMGTTDSYREIAARIRVERNPTDGIIC